MPKRIPVETDSGRTIHFPAFAKRDSTVDKWLMDEARLEAEHKNDDWALTLFRGLDHKNFSQSDRDSTNFYLFGELYPEFTTSGRRIRKEI